MAGMNFSGCKNPRLQKANRVVVNFKVILTISTKLCKIAQVFPEDADTEA